MESSLAMIISGNLERSVGNNYREEMWEIRKRNLIEVSSNLFLGLSYMNGQVNLSTFS